MTNSHRDFNKIANNEKRKGKTPPPFSLRLTFEERAKLDAAANGVPLGAYIRAILFDEELPKVRRRNTNPVKDHAALGRVLAALGGSHLASNLNQLARAVNTGTLPVHPEIENELREACANVAQMRAVLIEALGLDGGS
ncbi:hypothetical protein, partial [Roseibium sp.]|uniref:hypothetical protein n=1 Tax=Roseibium sp. TaxID=1936156 RepID=UPI001B126D36